MGTSWPRPSVGDYVMVTNGPMQNQEENALRYVRWGQLFADDGDQDLFGWLFFGEELVWGEFGVKPRRSSVDSGI